MHIVHNTQHCILYFICFVQSFIILVLFQPRLDCSWNICNWQFPPLMQNKKKKRKKIFVWKNICTRPSGNGRKFAISQRDVQWMFFKYFTGMSTALQPPNPDRIYGVKQQVVLITRVNFRSDCCIWGCFFPLSWHNYCYVEISQYIPDSC